MSRLKHFLLPSLWVLIVFIFSTSAFSGNVTVSYLDRIVLFFSPSFEPGRLKEINFFIRKAAHLVIYAVLAALWFKALPRAGCRPSMSYLTAFFICVAIGALDELHQAYTADRTALFSDTLLDSAAAAASLFYLSLRAKKSAARRGAAPPA